MDSSSSDQMASKSSRDHPSFQAVIRKASFLAPATEEKLTSFERWLAFLVDPVIFVNAVQLGVCVDPSVGVETVCEVSEHFFIAVFVMEFIAKVAMYRTKYFSNSWNRLDFLLVVVAVLDSWIFNPLVFMGQDTMRNVIVIRLMRLVRILRILKVFRTKPELRVLLEGLAASIKSMVWIALMFAFTIYAAAIICVSCFEEVETESQLTFNSVPEAMFTMFSIGLLADWTDIVMPVVQAYWWSAFFFAAFAFFTTIGMLNIIIGVITERTGHAQACFAAEAALEEDRQRMRKVREAADIIFGDDGDTFLSVKGLHDLMQDPTKSAHVSSIIGDIDLPLGYTVADLHRMLDKNSSGSVARNEFEDGFAQLCFSSDFQRSCVLLTAISDVKMYTASLLQEHLKPIRQEMETLLFEIRGRSGVRCKVPQGSPPSGAASGAAPELPPTVQADDEGLKQLSEHLSQFQQEVELSCRTQSSSAHDGGELVQAVHDLWSQSAVAVNASFGVSDPSATPAEDARPPAEGGTSEVIWQDSFTEAIHEYMTSSRHLSGASSGSLSQRSRGGSLGGLGLTTRKVAVRADGGAGEPE